MFSYFPFFFQAPHTSPNLPAFFYCYHLLISEPRPRPLELSIFPIKLFLTATTSTSFSRGFESFEKLVRRSLSVMKSDSCCAIGLIIDSWPAFQTDPDRIGVSKENNRRIYFVSTGRKIRTQILTHCCHSQSDERANLRTVIFQTDIHRSDVS